MILVEWSTAFRKKSNIYELNPAYFVPREVALHATPAQPWCPTLASSIILCIHERLFVWNT